MLLDGSARRSDVDASAEPAVKRLFSDGETTPMRVAGRRNVAEVRGHLDECGGRDASGRTALMIAAQQGHKKVREVLLEREKGMRVSEGMTALIHAAMNGHKGVVEVLLKHEKGMRDSQNHNALYYALKGGHTVTARVILPHDDPTDENGVTALMRAAERGDAEMVKLLAPLQKGAKDKDGNAAFIHALKNKYIGIALLLRESEALSWTPLMCAAFTGDIEIAKRHLSDKNKKNSKSETALMIAARAGHEDIVELLDQTDEKGVTALMRAAIKGDVGTVKALIPLQKGKKMRGNVVINELEMRSGGTALMWAAAYGYAGVVRLLMEHEGGMENKDGWPALMFAEQCGRSNERHGEPSVDYLKCVKLLMEREGKISGWTAFIYAAHRGNVNAVRNNLHTQGTRDVGGWTGLMYAAVQGHRKVVELLVKHQGGIQNNSHQTALMWAARNGHLECVKLLLEKEGCMQNDRGWTALMNAAWSGHLECARLLAEKEKGMRNIGGETACAIAKRRRHFSIVDLLAKYE